MGAQDSEQLWDKKGQVLSLEVPCKGSPCAPLLAKCPNQCWQPAPSLWDNKCHKTACQMQISTEFLMPGVSDSLFRAPHTNGKLLTAAALRSFSLHHSCLVYIPHVLTMGEEQTEHVNFSSLPPPCHPVCFYRFSPHFWKLL